MAMSCQMSNNITQPPPLLSHAQQQHQQQQPPPPLPIGLASQQLLRSKSLNDISNDSQISAFASDRFINIPLNCNNNNNGVDCMLTEEERADPSVTITSMPMDSSTYIYNQQQQNSNDININHAAINDSSTNNNNYNNSNNFYGNISFDNSRNLNSNQCSSRSPSQPPAATNIFNLCNPLAINLNGVTEQIGNLHL